MSNPVQHEKDGKAGFEHIYNQADPRQYFQTLGEFDYATPSHAQGVFSAMVHDRRAGANGNGNGNGTTVLDLCCSYGVNAALLNHDLTLDALYERYTSPDLADLSTTELADADREFYRQRRNPSPVAVVGLDLADRAVAYGERTGVLAAGLSENLEHHDPSDDLKRHLAQVDLITVTGGIGYISERTFARVLDSHYGDGPPSVAAFALRWVDYQPISETLEQYGLVTEKFTDATFPQRRFTDDEEQDYAIGQLASMNIDPTGKESEGEFHAELYVSRPPDQAVSTPLRELLDGAV